MKLFSPVRSSLNPRQNRLRASLEARQSKELAARSGKTSNFHLLQQ
jgi:hypothetical protein